MLITGSVGQIETDIAKPDIKSSAEHPSALGLICHPHPLHGGTMNNKVVTTIAKVFTELAAIAVRFNYRGVGQSEGEYGNGRGEIDDAEAVLTYAQQQYSDLPLWVAGFSFGGYIAANIAKQQQADLLICIAPGVENFDFSQLTEFPCPIIVVQGEEDEVVAADKVYAWFDSITTEKQLLRLPETSHFFHKKLIDLRQQLIQAVREETATPKS